MTKGKYRKFQFPKVIVQTTIKSGKEKGQWETSYGPFELRRGPSDDEFVRWSLFAKKDRGFNCIGDFDITSRFSKTDELVAIVCGCEIFDEDYKGIGLGKKVYLLLANHYGILESDIDGSTSLEAKRVWKALKAKKISNGRFCLKGKNNE